MAIEIKTLKQTQQLLKNELIKAFNVGVTDPQKKIDPTIKNQALVAMINSISLGIYENNRNIQRGINDVFLGGDTWANFWGSEIGVNNGEATSATGNIVITGTTGTSIIAGTLITNANGIQYSVNDTVTIATQNININSIVRVGNLVTVTTEESHNLASNTNITITGADQTAYNVVNQEISVNSTKTFTFEIATAPISPATGTLQVTFSNAVANITSTTLGTNANVGALVELTFVNTFAGVDSSVFTTFDTISGGTDLESNTSYNNRVTEKFQSYFVQPFTSIGIPIFLKEAVIGITRVWVLEVTPKAGYVTIYFVRDNDINIFPSAIEIEKAKNAIINGTDKFDKIKQGNISDNFVIVDAPTPLPVNFTFTGLQPCTQDMRDSITNNLQDFFKSQVDLGKTISKNLLINLIFNTTDSLGNTPNIATSIVDINPQSNELPILGNVTYV